MHKTLPNFEKHLLGRVRAAVASSAELQEEFDRRRWESRRTKMFERVVIAIGVVMALSFGCTFFIGLGTDHDVQPISTSSPLLLLVTVPPAVVAALILVGFVSGLAFSGSRLRRNAYLPISDDAARWSPVYLFSIAAACFAVLVAGVGIYLRFDIVQWSASIGNIALLAGLTTALISLGRTWLQRTKSMLRWAELGWVIAKYVMWTFAVATVVPVTLYEYDMWRMGTEDWQSLPDHHFHLGLMWHPLGWGLAAFYFGVVQQNRIGWLYVVPAITLIAVAYRLRRTLTIRELILNANETQVIVDDGTPSGATFSYEVDSSSVRTLADKREQRVEECKPRVTMTPSDISQRLRRRRETRQPRNLGFVERLLFEWLTWDERRCYENSVESSWHATVLWLVATPMLALLTCASCVIAAGDWKDVPSPTIFTLHPAWMLLGGGSALISILVLASLHSPEKLEARQRLLYLPLDPMTHYRVHFKLASVLTGLATTITLPALLITSYVVQLSPLISLLSLAGSTSLLFVGLVLTAPLPAASCVIPRPSVTRYSWLLFYTAIMFASIFAIVGVPISQAITGIVVQIAGSLGSYFFTRQINTQDFHEPTTRT